MGSHSSLVPRQSPLKSLFPSNPTQFHPAPETSFLLPSWDPPVSGLPNLDAPPSPSDQHVRHSYTHSRILTRTHTHPLTHSHTHTSSHYSSVQRSVGQGLETHGQNSTELTVVVRCPLRFTRRWRERKVGVRPAREDVGVVPMERHVSTRSSFECQLRRQVTDCGHTGCRSRLLSWRLNEEPRYRRTGVDRTGPS